MELCVFLKTLKKGGSRHNTHTHKHAHVTITSTIHSTKMHARKKRLKLQGEVKDKTCCICMGESKELKTCVKDCVCTTTLHDGSKKKICKHSFCFKCIKRWSDEQNTCPLCRKTFTFLICSKRIYRPVPDPIKMITADIGSFVMMLVRDDDLFDGYINATINGVPDAISVSHMVLQHFDRFRNHFNLTFRQFSEFYPRHFALDYLLRNIALRSVSL